MGKRLCPHVYITVDELVSGEAPRVSKSLSSARKLNTLERARKASGGLHGSLTGSVHDPVISGFVSAPPPAIPSSNS